MIQAVRLLIFAAVFSIFSGSAFAATGIALLIGNEKYQSTIGPLSSPGKDLELIKRSLMEVGLDESQIVMIKDASRIQMLSAIEDFAVKARHLNNDEIAFFYYAGHGAKKPNSGAGLHLIPTSAQDVSSSSFWYETINFNKDVVDAFTNSESRAAWILAIDACRNELKIPSNTRGADRGFGIVPSSSGMLISFAADDNQTAKDNIGGSANSPYAMALSKYLRTPNQRISAVFGAVRPDVMERTSYVQEPVYTNKLNRDPILIEIGPTPKPEPKPTPKPEPKPGPLSLVQQLQQEMADLGDDVRRAIGAGDNGKSVDAIAMRWKKENSGNYSPRIARLFKASCLLGQPVACTDYGYLKDTGNGGVTVDDAEAVNYYLKGCDGGSPTGCSNVGYMYEKGIGTGQNYYSAVSYYRKGCDGGAARGCTNLGYMYDTGKGVDKSYAQALTYYDKGCSGDNSTGCFNLGSLYEYGLGTTANKPKALELYQKAVRLNPNYEKAKKGIDRLKNLNVNPVKPKTLAERLQEDLADLGYEVKNAIVANDNGKTLNAIGLKWKKEDGNTFTRRVTRVFDAACQLGSGGACVDAGFVHEKGYAGYPVSFSKAVEYYQSSCILNYYLGCSNLGYMYEKGRGVSKDETTALRYYRTACNGGNPLGCTNLGYMYESGKGMGSSDLATAVTYYRKGCDGGNALGCTNLGYMYEQGRGTGSVNLYTAVSYYQKGCDGGNIRGCANLGWMYETGKGTTRDYFKAASYYTKACNADYARSCTNLGYLYDTGNGVSGGKNMYKAVEYYRKGCTGRNSIGCSNLAIMYENGYGGLSKSTTEAIRYYRQALEINPSDEKVKSNLRRLGVTP